MDDFDLVGGQSSKTLGVDAEIDFSFYIPQ